MELYVSLLMTSLVLSRLTAAGTDQRPLIASHQDTFDSADLALAKLQRAIGARLIKVVPIGAPCYQNISASDAQCHYSSYMRSNDSFISDHPAGYFYGNLASCQSEAQTCILPLNDTAIDQNSTCFIGVVPPLMINMTTPEDMLTDIQHALDYVRSANKPLVVKNTGHDWKGRSTGPEALALWTHNLRSPTIPIQLDRNFTPEGCRQALPETVFHYGPAEQWGSAYKFANDSGLAVVGGTCPSVGIAGWLQGGGHSPMTPVFGMGVDNVRQVTVVTPQNGTLIANECINSDLFFAVRGGGGGTFGVLTNIAYKAINKTEIRDFRFYLSFNESDVHKYLEIVTANMPDWTQKGWGGYMKFGPKNQSVELINPNRTWEEATRDMRPITDFIIERKGSYKFLNHSSWYDYVHEVMVPHDVHVGTWSWTTSSRLLPKPLFEEPIRQNLTTTLMEMYKKELLYWIMLVTPTRFAHTNTSSLHPSWSNATASIRSGKRWDQYFDQSNKAKYLAHYEQTHYGLDGIRQLVDGMGMGVSISEADLWEDNPGELFWGNENYDRLKRIKTKYDPENILTNYQAVGWNAKDQRYRCYPKKP